MSHPTTVITSSFLVSSSLRKEQVCFVSCPESHQSIATKEQCEMLLVYAQQATRAQAERS